MIQQDYYLDSISQPAWQEPVNDDYRRLMHCFWVFGTFCAIAGMIYFFTRDIKVAAGICGAVGVLLTLYHTPFGLFILFSLHAIENAVVLNPYFTVSKAMGIIVLISFIFQMSRNPITITKPLKLMIAFTAWAFLSSIWAILPYYTLLFIVTFILNIGLTIIILSTIKDEKSLFLIVAGFAAGAIVASLMVATGAVAPQDTKTAEIGRVALGEETNTLVLALALGIGFIASFFAFFQKGKFKKLIAVGAMPLIFLAMVKTQSRMPTVAALSIPVIAMVLENPGASIGLNILFSDV